MDRLVIFRIHFDTYRIAVPKKCPFVNMKELSLQNTYREYHYSDSYKVRDQGHKLNETQLFAL